MAQALMYVLLIIGGGIIGLSTAYSLARACLDTRQPASKARVIVVEQASTVCSGASGQCEGSLRAFGFPSDAAPLAKQSYRLHEQFAAEHQGKQLFGYSQLKIHVLFHDNYDLSNPRLPIPIEREEDATDLPHLAQDGTIGCPEILPPSPETLWRARGTIHDRLRSSSSTSRELASLWPSTYMVLAAAQWFKPAVLTYMPRTARGQAIIDRLPEALLFPEANLGAKTTREREGGVYLNFGHDLNGFTLGLGSGKVMAELILGHQTSVGSSTVCNIN
ncbi:hypothetical protein QQS21_007050 [Conoideocrella luteorostrata]|uniref:FAD dependent oxidoreductase domain-containing protein n=1 Tax=Conoideocrella luteorostrata TaxID=1105319 RepID=A0AAJ0CNY1_9HYPO|nr:hypothetical protein QQS21_007050 [Conoideocrella luteorostrata]